jgi:hypothetical protein
MLKPQHNNPHGKCQKCFALTVTTLTIRRIKVKTALPAIIVNCEEAIRRGSAAP